MIRISEQGWNTNGIQILRLLLVHSFPLKIDGEQINRNERPLYCGLFCPAIVGAKSPTKLARRLLGQDVF